MDFALYCNQDCTHEAVTGRGMSGGQLAYGAPVARKCRAQEELKVTRGPGGDLQVSDTQLWFEPGTPIAVDDRITYKGFAFRVGAVLTGQGLDWEDHVRVYLEARHR